MYIASTKEITIKNTRQKNNSYLGTMWEKKDELVPK